MTLKREDKGAPVSRKWIYCWIRAAAVVIASVYSCSKIGSNFSQHGFGEALRTVQEKLAEKKFYMNANRLGMVTTTVGGNVILNRNTDDNDGITCPCTTMLETGNTNNCSNQQNRNNR